MAIKAMLWTLSVIISPLLVVSARAESFARYELSAPATASELDGDLNDACWEEALVVSALSPRKRQVSNEADRVETRSFLFASKAHSRQHGPQ